MIKSRRNFIRRSGTLAGLSAISSFLSPVFAQSMEETLKGYQHLSAEDCAKDESFWQQIRQAYTVSSTIINLNNGGVAPQPKVVQEAMMYYNQLSNQTPTYYMWRILDREREPLRNKIAELAGCSADEIAINRNASEALETVIFGLRLMAGDEVVLTRQDYPNMINAWKQRAVREGIVLKWINFEFPIEDKDFMVRKFTEAFTDKTRVVHITHMINWTGQILPVREIADKARESGIEVVVDGAHTFAHLNFKIPNLHCDYFGTSLHKWLSAPFGTGMLYVKKDKIKNLYPLFAGDEPESEKIQKFESLGTRSFPIEFSIGHAIDFFYMIGAERKEKRLQYLKNYWINGIKHLPNVEILTSENPTFSGAIGMFAIKDKPPVEVHNYLFNKHRIHTVAINRENIHGVRVTPNVYTLIRELDFFIEKVIEFAKG